MRYSIVNLGCKVNRVESDGFERKLSAMPGSIPVEADADIVVINTCAVTSMAEKKTRKGVRRALKDNPRAYVIVTGCAAAQDKSIYESMSERVIATDRLDVADRISDVAKMLGCHDAACGNEPGSHPNDGGVGLGGQAPISASKHDLPARMGVKVQDGCDNECSYCIVHTLRGRERSIPRSDIIEECLRLAAEGIPEIMLTGINTGRYDDDGVDLKGLSDELLSLGLPSRLRISSIEPKDFDVGVAALAEDSGGMLCRHFHIPVQSGSTKVLRQMNRDYDEAFIRDLVRSIRAEAPTASISTDMIVGFPGETDSEFEETMALCEALAFSKVHVFPYSKRDGTPASKRRDQVEPAIKRQRVRALQRLATRLRDMDLASRIGSTELVVVESATDCLTESYHWVKAPAGAPIRSLVPAKL